MENPIVLVLLGVLVGIIGAWLFLQSRVATATGRFSIAETALSEAREELKAQSNANIQLGNSVARLEATLQHERGAAEEKLGLLSKATEILQNAFKALSADALKSNNQAFLDLAKSTLEKFQSEAKGDLDQRQKAIETLVTPIQESLAKVDVQVREMENARQQAYGSLSEQMKSLVGTQEQLRVETGKLVKALRTPTVRGRWGEIQLRRVVEMAGMVPYCDFTEQTSVSTEDGRLRPDVIVKLPGAKNVVVDAKAPLLAYLEALEAQEEEARGAHLKDHARQISNHMALLSSKAYWEQFDSTPEFVVMFLPGEIFFSAALEQNPGLIEEGVNQRVILASPTTLIALLRAVAYGWRQETIAQSAQRVSDLGKELYDRLRTVASHVEGMGKGLGRAVDEYNKAIGSLEGRVLVSARRFKELGVSTTGDIEELAPLEGAPRSLQVSDWSIRSVPEGSSADGR